VLDTNFQFKDLDTGKILEVRPDAVKPFNLEALIGTRREGSPGLPLTFRSTDTRIGEDQIHQPATITTTIEFDQSPKPYVLVPDGWSPLALSSTRHFLIDRNILSLLGQLDVGKSNRRLERFAWWWSLLDKESVSLNPLPSAFEGGQQQPLSFIEFAEAFETASERLRGSVKKAEVVRLGKEGLQAAFAEVQAVQSRQSREAELLVELCPAILANAVKREHRRQACEDILNALQSRDLDPFSLVSLCVMSALYRAPAGGDYSIGQRLLKPSQNYTPQDAYNALSDLRHLEIAAIATGLFLDPPALLTEDKVLTALWTVLRPKGTITAQGCALVLQVDPSLFTGLHPRDAERLIQLLRNQ
jgi:hypothetical protein